MKKINLNEMTFNKPAFTAVGIIKGIKEKSRDKASSKGDKYYSNTTVSIEVNGKIQQIDFFGETVPEGNADNREFQTMLRTAEGKAEKGSDDKAIRKKVLVKDYDAKKHMFFEAGEIYAYKNKEKVTWKEYASTGDLAKFLTEEKTMEKLIGQPVMIKGKMDIKEAYQNEGVIEFKPQGIKIQMMKLEEGKKLNEEFTFTAPVVFNMLDMPHESQANGKGLVPINLSTFIYKDKANHTRNIPITINPSTFFGIPTVPMETRLMLFSNLLCANTDNSALVGFIGRFSYDNGYEERTLTIEDISDDPTFAQLIATGTYGDAELIDMYKRFNQGITFRKELVSNMSLLSIQQEDGKINICPLLDEELPNGKSSIEKATEAVMAEVAEVSKTNDFDDEFPF